MYLDATSTTTTISTTPTTTTSLSTTFNTTPTTTSSTSLSCYNSNITVTGLGDPINCQSNEKYCYVRLKIYVFVLDHR